MDRRWEIADFVLKSTSISVAAGSISDLVIGREARWKYYHQQISFQEILKDGKTCEDLNVCFNLNWEREESVM